MNLESDSSDLEGEVARLKAYSKELEDDLLEALDMLEQYERQLIIAGRAVERLLKIKGVASSLN